MIRTGQRGPEGEARPSPCTSIVARNASAFAVGLLASSWRLTRRCHFRCVDSTRGSAARRMVPGGAFRIRTAEPARQPAEIGSLRQDPAHRLAVSPEIR